MKRSHQLQEIIMGMEIYILGILAYAVVMMAAIILD
tara:strand:+ start:221 stop:328 length:108 start_codon:yes stop_codon:yes gene_type:complete